MEDTPICIYCNIRVAVRRQRKKKFLLCAPCDNIISAENLWKQVGIPKPKNKPRNLGLTPSNLAERAAQFRALVGQGKTFSEIADLWGVGKQQLSAAIYRCRREGYEVPYVSHPGREQKPYAPPPPRPKLGRPKRVKRNEHGGGKTGVYKCNAGPDGKICDPCRKVKQAARKRVDERAALRRKLER